MTFDKYKGYNTLLSSQITDPILIHSKCTITDLVVNRITSIIDKKKIRKSDARLYKVKVEEGKGDKRVGGFMLGRCGLVEEAVEVGGGRWVREIVENRRKVDKLVWREWKNR